MTFMDRFEQRKAELDRTRRTGVESFHAEEMARFIQEIQSVLPVGVEITQTTRVGIGELRRVIIDLGRSTQGTLTYYSRSDHGEALISDPARPRSSSINTFINPWPTSKNAFEEILIGACVKLGLKSE